ncbi:MAG: hypothetical protein M0R38_08920 [Bacteroidia bacterium]|nr:hypothetical protein [Bacteroidia bacterium]
MKIRNKILIYFSTTIIILAALTLSAIYILFAEYREEEFQERMNEKVNYSIELIGDYQVRNRELLDLIDKQNIHDFYDEKLLVFDSKKKLVFSSINDLPIKSANEITNQLSPSNRWIETKDGDYDLIGVYIEKKQRSILCSAKSV